MSWQIESNTVRTPNGAVVTFDHPVGETAEIGGALVVLLQVPANQSMPENVFGVSTDGRILWQIEPVTAAGAKPYFYYAAIKAQGDDWVRLWNYGCFLVDADVRTGKVKRVEEKRW